MAGRECCVLWEDALVLIFGRIISFRIKTLCTVLDTNAQNLSSMKLIRSLCRVGDRIPWETETRALMKAAGKRKNGGAGMLRRPSYKPLADF